MAWAQVCNDYRTHLTMDPTRFPSVTRDLGSRIQHLGYRMLGICHGIQNLVFQIRRPEPGCSEIGFQHISLKTYSLFANEAHKQYSLLDTIFNYIFCLGPPGKHLYLSSQVPLHVLQRSRPTYSRFACLFIDVFVEVQDQRYD